MLKGVCLECANNRGLRIRKKTAQPLSSVSSPGAIIIIIIEHYLLGTTIELSTGDGELFSFLKAVRIYHAFRSHDSVDGRDPIPGARLLPITPLNKQQC